MGRGLVFEVREYCVHDGPGVRTTVFLMGCPLRCAWCQNPEGQELRPVLLYSASRCTHCGVCKKVCPRGCVSEACTACGACSHVCPEGCRRLCGTWYEAKELADLLNRHGAFLRENGGVTFSGGDPLVQGEYVLEVAQLLQPMHVCLETCGHGSEELYRRVVSGMDLIYQDLKLMDSDVHLKYTGVDNTLILRNVSWLLRESGKPCVIRVPLITGVTDSRDNLRAIAEFVAGSPALEGVQLLPYNYAAGTKYTLLGREYNPPFNPDAPCNPDVSIFRELGVPCAVM